MNILQLKSSPFLVIWYLFLAFFAIVLLLHLFFFILTKVTDRRINHLTNKAPKA